jgi:hypothetical protein
MLLELFGLEEEEEDRISPMLRVQAPLYRRGPGYRLGNDSAGCQLLSGGILGMTLSPCSDSFALQSTFSLGPASGRHMPSLCLGSYRGEGSLVSDWLDLVVALVTPVLGLCRSCRGQPTFSKVAVGWFLSLLSGSGLPRWKRQPAVGTAGPLGEAGPLAFESWRLLGRRPSDSSARGMPHKSSPRH